MGDYFKLFIDNIHIKPFLFKQFSYCPCCLKIQAVHIERAELDGGGGEDSLGTGNLFLLEEAPCLFHCSLFVLCWIVGEFVDNVSTLGFFMTMEGLGMMLIFILFHCSKLDDAT